MCVRERVRVVCEGECRGGKDTPPSPAKIKGPWLRTLTKIRVLLSKNEALLALLQPHHMTCKEPGCLLQRCFKSTCSLRLGPHPGFLLEENAPFFPVLLFLRPLHLVVKRLSVKTPWIFFARGIAGWRVNASTASRSGFEIGFRRHLSAVSLSNQEHSEESV